MTEKDQSLFTFNQLYKFIITKGTLNQGIKDLEMFFDSQDLT